MIRTLIAAIVLVHRLTVATLNDRDFEVPPI